MSRRLEIELTSERPDGTWTWRAAGAKLPKGELDGGLLPGGAVVGEGVKLAVRVMVGVGESSSSTGSTSSRCPLRRVPASSPSCWRSVVRAARSRSLPHSSSRAGAESDLAVGGTVTATTTADSVATVATEETALDATDPVVTGHADRVSRSPSGRDPSACGPDAPTATL